MILERHVEQQCDALVQQHGGRIVRYSQPRASKQTAGIADREYYVLGAKIRFECKASDGKLSQDQLELLTLEHLAGGLVCVGGVQELKHLLIALRHSKDLARDLGQLFLELWAARGVRRTTKPTPPRNRDR